MKPDGTIRSCDRYRRVVTMIAVPTMVATSSSMKTCLVIEKSMPKMGGRWMTGCSNPPLATCPMIVSVGSNPPAACPVASAASAACSSC